MYRLKYLIKYAFGKRIVQFKMPDLGQTTVKKWHVKQGDYVKQFEKVADVQTDKLFTQITSTDGGKISERFHEQQQKCQVGQLFLKIQVQDQSKEAVHNNNKIQGQIGVKEQSLLSQKEHHKEITNDKIMASPAVRSLIKQHKINHNNIIGTGKAGRIMKQDILKFIEAKNKNQQPKQHSESPKQKKQVFVDHKFEGKLIEMNNYQKGMQKSMTLSNQIPHLYYKDEVDITNLSKLRKSLNSIYKDKLSFMTFFLKSFSLALSSYPILNSTYNAQDPFTYKTYNHHNISIAMDTQKGLVVPNIKRVEIMNIRELQANIQTIRIKGKQGKMGKKQLQQGTICVSNIGSIGGTYVGPLILSPQVCIVAIGKTTEQPKFINNEIKARQMVINNDQMHISFGCDHRVVDGATVARFSNKWKEYLQNPQLMLAQLK